MGDAQTQAGVSVPGYAAPLERRWHFCILKTRHSFTAMACFTCVFQSSFSHSVRLSCMVERISLSALRCCVLSPRGMGPITLLFMLPESK